MAKKSINAPVGNMVIGQSGGPTVVINQSLVGAVLEADQTLSRPAHSLLVLMRPPMEPENDGSTGEDEERPTRA